MEDCETKIGISKRVNRLVMPLGMSMNSNGTAMYLAMASITIAQFFGMKCHGNPVQSRHYVDAGSVGTIVVLAAVWLRWQLSCPPLGCLWKGLPCWQGLTGLQVHSERF